MTMPTSPTPTLTSRRNLSILIALLLSFLTGYILALSSTDQLRLTKTSFSPTRPPSCPPTCPPDPYTQPGQLIFHPLSPSLTRWTPFPRIPLDVDDSGNVQIGNEGRSRVDELDRTIRRLNAGGSNGSSDTSEPSRSDGRADAGGWTTLNPISELAVPSYTSSIKSHGESITSASSDGSTGEGILVEWESGFARDRVVLFIGSSHDRNNVVHFCQAVNGQTRTWGYHIATMCHVEWLNLKVISWFMVGMVDSESADWFREHERRPITFVRRIKEIMLPIMDEAGVGGDVKPDLIVLGSLFWDEVFLTEHGRHLGYYDDDEASGRFGFYPQELAWHRGRVAELVLHLRRMYGRDTPLMIRTRQHRGRNEHGGALKIAQLDQGVRTVARDLDVKLFTWGDKLEGWLEFVDDDQHFGYGPTTYIFGDMFLFYLRQATLPGCWACSQTPSVLL